VKGGGSGGGGGHGRQKCRHDAAAFTIALITHLETGSDGFTTPSSNAIAATAPWRMRSGQPWDEAEVRVRGDDSKWSLSVRFRRGKSRYACK
jgi:hypothetical protein